MLCGILDSTLEQKKDVGGKIGEIQIGSVSGFSKVNVFVLITGLRLRRMLTLEEAGEGALCSIFATSL